MNNNNTFKAPFVAVDLFAGGGGLTLGLKQAGFVVSAAVELDRTACETYQANHPATVLFQSDIRHIAGNELVRTSPTNRIDLIAACPPCQGFSQLTAKYRRIDPRNELVLEFVRLVDEVRPPLVMMENVPRLTQDGLFKSTVARLEGIGYKLTYDVLDVADYGVPQRRRRLVMLGSLTGQVTLPKPTHARVPAKGVKPWVTVRDAIGGESKPLTLRKADQVGGPNKARWHVVRSLSELNIERLRATRAGLSRVQLPDALRPQCHKGLNSGFSNVYGRMSWGEPAPTITGGCTTLSKGRFGHPSALRTISVREAATLQSFPKSYVLKTQYIDRACIIIGSALPPRFAKAMAAACFKRLETMTNV